MNENIRPHSVDRRKAQAEIYADFGVKKFSDDQENIYKNLNALAAIDDLDHPPEGTDPEILKLIVDHKDSYRAFILRERKAEIIFAEQNARTYRDEYKPVVRKLQEQLAQNPDATKLPGYLGRGSRGFACASDIGSRAIAVKFSQDRTQSQFELKSLLRGKGIPHIAQIVAYSAEDAVKIMELLPGFNLEDREKRPQNLHFPPDHIFQLINTIFAMNAHGLRIDPKISNYMYSPSTGFSILDYHLGSSGDSYYGGDYGLPHQIADMIKIVMPPQANDALDILEKDHPEIIAAWAKEYRATQAEPRRGVTDFVERFNLKKRLGVEDVVFVEDDPNSSSSMFSEILKKAIDDDK